MATAEFPSFDAPVKIDTGAANYRVAMAGREHPSTRVPRIISREKSDLALVTFVRVDGVWDNPGTQIADATQLFGEWAVYPERFVYDNGGNIMYVWIESEGGDNWIHTLYQPISGQPVLTLFKQEQPPSNFGLDRFRDSLALDLNTQGEFVMSYLPNIEQFVSSVFNVNDLKFVTWDVAGQGWITGGDLGSASVFGKAKNLRRPGPVNLNNDFGLNNHDMAISPRDGQYHFIANYSHDLSPVQPQWYYIRYDPSTHTEIEWEKFPVLGFPLEAAQAKIAASYNFDGVAFVILWNFDATSQRDHEVVFWTNESGDWISFVISTRPQGPCTPDIFVDTNDDIYVTWSEHTVSDNKRVVFVRRRLGGTWEDEIRVAVTEQSSPNQNRSGTIDPEYTTIIRPHRDRPLLELCIVWGAEEVAVGPDDTFIYQVCSQVRTTDSSTLSIRNLQTRRFDGVLGGAWASWTGKDV